MPCWRSHRSTASRPDGIGVAEALVPTTFVLPGLDALAAALAASAGGRVGERPVFYANVPSVLDHTMRPPGGAEVFSLEVLYTPYALAGGWPGSGEPARWLEIYGETVQSGFVDSVVDWRAMTPPSYEEQFSMPRGPRRRVLRIPAVGAAGSPASPHPLHHADQRPVLRRRGHVPRRGRLGSLGPQRGLCRHPLVLNIARTRR